MYRQSFQGCPFLMLLEAKGSNPMQQWDTKKGQCTRLYNKDVKTYVVDLTGNSTQSIKLPTGDKPLAITQQYLGFQMFLPKDSPFCMTITIETTSKVKIRLVLSTSIKVVKVSTLHARIPFHIVSGAWTAVVVDMFELSHLFPHQEFSNLISLELTPFATFMRIFSLNACPLPTIELYSEQDQQDLVRNPRLPPPKFSKRQHHPLDGKLTTYPMHIQVIDEFYATLFQDNKLHTDICIRDVAAIIEARKVFMPQFNQYDQYEQFGVKITKTQINDVQEVNQDDVGHAANEMTTKQSATSNTALTIRNINPKPKPVIKPRQSATVALKPSPVKQIPKKTQQQPTGSIQATIDQLKQQHQVALEQKEEIDKQLSTISTQRLNQDFEKMQQQKIKDNLQQLQKNTNQHFQQNNAKQPPKIMKDISNCQNDGYCAENIDLTLNAIPVQIDAAKTCKHQNTDPNDRRQLTPVRRGGQVVNAEHQKQTPKPIALKDEDVKFDEMVIEEVPEEENEDLKSKQQKLSEEEREELEQQEYAQQNTKNILAEQEPELSKTAVQIHIPDPGTDCMDTDQNLLPDPADYNLIKDPIAYGLEYDAETGCYYERE